VILGVIPLVVRMLFADRIGHLVDKYGPKKVLIISSILFVFNPLLWVFGTTFWQFILIRIFTGFSFGVFEISSAAFFMNETNSSNRMDLMSYFNFVNGVFIIIGALAANLFLKLGPFDNIFLNAFMWSAIFRFAVLIFFFPRKVKEKGHYSTSSYVGLGWKMVFENKPGKIVENVADRAGIIAIKMKEKDTMITRLKNGGVIGITKKKGFSGVDPSSSIKKKKPKVQLTKKYEYIRYACEKCNQTFRRHPDSSVALRCPICGHGEVHFVSYEEEHK
jgi:MFS family permease